MRAACNISHSEAACITFRFAPLPHAVRRLTGFSGPHYNRTSLSIALPTNASLGTETIFAGGISTHRGVEGAAGDAKNCDRHCIVVSGCCSAGELEVNEMAIKHVLPLLVRIRSTDAVIAALRQS
jgi:nicotinamidase-related amidase